MDLNTLAQGGAAGAFIALALYLVKVIVNDMKHDISAMRASSEKQETLLARVVVLLEQPARTARHEERDER